LTLPAALLGSTVVRAEIGEVDRVTLQWDPSEPKEGVTIDGYMLYYDLDSGIPYEGTFAEEGESPIRIPMEDLEDPTRPAFDLHGAPSCAPVYFAVSAYNENNESDVSNEASAKIPFWPDPVVVSRDGDTLVLEWASPPADSGPLGKYLVYYDTDEPGEPYDGTGAAESDSPLVLSIEEGGDAPEAQLTGLVDLPQLYLTVAVQCASGEQKTSDEISVSFGEPQVKPEEPDDPGSDGPGGSASGGCALGNAPPLLSGAALLLLGCLWRRRRPRR
jgi:hypothetical protein